MDIEEAKRYAEAIRTINRYEISTPMKDSDRLLQIEGGKPKITCEISPTLLEYAGRCATYLEFIRQLGTLRFTEDGRSAKRIPGEDAKQPLRNDLLLGTTPKIYQQLGFQADPLLYTRRHALKALAPKASKGEQFRHNHGIDPKLMCQVPLLLEDPVLIYNSPNSNSRICVVLNQVDGDNPTSGGAAAELQIGAPRRNALRELELPDHRVRQEQRGLSAQVQGSAERGSLHKQRKKPRDRTYIWDSIPQRLFEP